MLDPEKAIVDVQQQPTASWVATDQSWIPMMLWSGSWNQA